MLTVPDAMCYTESTGRLRSSANIDIRVCRRLRIAYKTNRIYSLATGDY